MPSFGQNTGAGFTTLAGFTLGNWSLGQIEKVLGPAVLVESGDAGGYEAKLCYVSNVDRVKFLSGEMGGPNHQLLGFAVSRVDDSTQCSKLTAGRLPNPLSLGGLKLGQSRAEFSRVLATKVTWDADVGRAVYESKRKMKPVDLKTLPADVRKEIKAGRVQNYFDVVVGVTGKFSDGKLVEFRVWKVETF
ncbi:MAG: hypothetical protein ING60_18045 [Rhodocyclaceae bacterium]|nr:hypothetical protein [Rhodocyclaceae bacterium]